MYIEVQGIEIPVNVDEFDTPDWERVMDFHVEWKGICRSQGKPPWGMQAYFLSYLTQLVRTRRLHRQEQEWMHEINQRFGAMTFFGKYSKRDLQSGGEPLDTMYND